MADYTTLTAVKNLPAGIHSSSRYLKTFPANAENAAWGEAYKTKYGDYPTNWSWENSLAVSFLTTGDEKDEFDGFHQARRCNPRHEGQIAVRRGRHGDDARGRPHHHRLRTGLGHDGSQGSVGAERDAGDWKTILEYEAEWKKKMGYA